MPVYTYRCGNCGVEIERQQKFSDRPLVRCPECSKNTLKKVISPVRVVFKGSGFYATDHNSPSGDKSSSHREKHHHDHKDEASKSESKAESTPAAPAKSSSDSSE